MNNNKLRYLIAAIAMILASTAAFAQNTRSGYFVDQYTYRFQMNPAIDNDKGFVSMPALGNVNVNMSGNIGVKDLFYPIDGKTCLFVHPDVDTRAFMNRIHNVNKVAGNVKLGVMSTGFKAFNGYNTISINARVNTDTHIPKSFFSLLKEGVKNGEYSISDLNERANAFVEIALGHSHEINKEWRVGGTFKFLVGAGEVNTDFKNSRLVLGEDSWDIEADATLNGMVKGLKYTTAYNETTGNRYVDGMKVDNTGINGFGAAVDLGVVYTPEALPDWEFSAALLDLGAIRWNENNVASTNGLKAFKSSDYTFNVEDDADNSFSKEWDKMSDALAALYELDDMGNTGPRTTMIGATMNLGVKYSLPVYDKLSFGLLNTTYINGRYTCTDFRLSANIAPAKIFSAGINAAVGTYGASFGWLASLHVTGFNLFVGMDHTPGKFAKQGIPLSSNASVNFGMNFLF